MWRWTRNIFLGHRSTHLLFRLRWLLNVLILHLVLIVDHCTTGRHTMLPHSVDKVDLLMVDPHFSEAAIEAGHVAKMPLLVGMLCWLDWQATEIHWRGELEELFRAIIDDRTSLASIDAKCEILLDGQEFNQVVSYMWREFKKRNLANKVFSFPNHIPQIVVVIITHFPSATISKLYIVDVG